MNRPERELELALHRDDPELDDMIIKGINDEPILGDARGSAIDLLLWAKRDHWRKR